MVDESEKGFTGCVAGGFFAIGRLYFRVTAFGELRGEGISRDTCYLAEQNRQASMNAAYEKQALENAAAAVQHSQSAKVKTRHFNGMEIKGTSTGLSIDGKAAAVIEKNKDATVYQQGLYNFIVYANGKIAVTQDGVFKGYAK